MYTKRAQMCCLIIQTCVTFLILSCVQHQHNQVKVYPVLNVLERVLANHVEWKETIQTVNKLKKRKHGEQRIGVFIEIRRKVKEQRRKIFTWFPHVFLFHQVDFT
jgi:hypothetical protein